MTTAKPRAKKTAAASDTLKPLIEPIATLPTFTARVYESIVLGLYAEPGFSDVTSDQIAKELNCKPMQVVGALKKLADLKLAKADSGMLAETATSGKLPIIYATGWNKDEHADEWKLRTLAALAARLGPASLQATPVATPSPVAQPKAKRARQSTKPEAAAPAAPAQVIEALLLSDGAEPTPELVEAVLSTALRTPQGRATVAQRLAKALAEQGS